ncbi:unnamed protein product [Sphagnum jensenii]|uniref:Uncharacterized protein n=1 Tax=Sphagnum jensenii TaxID=128206 RepID=A0ABP0WED4_9BRYO
MHGEETERGLKFGSGGTRPVSGKETKGGARIKSRGTRPMRKEETNGGGKLKGHVLKGDGEGGKLKEVTDEGGKLEEVMGNTIVRI